MADDIEGQDTPSEGSSPRGAKKAAAKKLPAKKAAAAKPAGEAAKERAEPGSDPTVAGAPRTEDDAAESTPSGQPGPATASVNVDVNARVLTDEEAKAFIARLKPAERNALVPGTLTVHYKSRDVDFPLDGASAMRLLAVLAGTDNDVDLIDQDSDARRGWAMIDRAEVLGAQWAPQASVVPRRATIDPGELVDSLR
jgi:hypothetical protein